MSSPERWTHALQSQAKGEEAGIQTTQLSDDIIGRISDGGGNLLGFEETSTGQVQSRPRDLIGIDKCDENKQNAGYNHAQEMDRKERQQLRSKTQKSSISSDAGLAESNNTLKAANGKPDGLRAMHDRELQAEIYLDPTPRTPRHEVSPSRAPPVGNNAQRDNASTSEIQSIMDQFDKAVEGIREEQRSSSDLSNGDSLLEAPSQHPPRRSSLEPMRSGSPNDATQSTGDAASSASGLTAVSTPKRKSNIPSPTQSHRGDFITLSSPNSSSSLPKMPPPQPDLEPDLPFDFHRFLEQLRHRTADPVAKFLRSFLVEFGKKQWMVHEQVKIINDFLAFITNKMSQCEVWRGISDAEFDNAKEGMEKLVMNRLYAQTFSPAIQPPGPIPGTKGKKKTSENVLSLGRRGQHQEDIERDEILGQKVRIYGWVQEAHLDIPPVGDGGRRFLLLAQQELLKIKTYRAPRDKIICVLNCCKVIFGLLRNSKASDTSADSFIPLLIYVVLRANPEHLVSNVQYILRFRNQDKLGGEAGYYLSSLLGAIQFIENLDRTSLTISDEQFEKNVEAAISVIVERHKDDVLSPSPSLRQAVHSQVSEKSGLSQPEVVPRHSIEAEYSTPTRPTSSRDKSKLPIGNDGSDDSTAVSGLLRTIQRPLSSLGRMFSEEPSNVSQGPQSGLGPRSISSTRLSPALFLPPRHSDEVERSTEDENDIDKTMHDRERRLSAEDAAARQASAEAAEAQRLQRAEHNNVVETLAGMFPDLDKDIIDDVVRMKQGRVGLAVDACLALTS